MIFSFILHEGDIINIIAISLKLIKISFNSFNNFFIYDEINEKIINIQGHYDILTNNKYIEDLIKKVFKVVSELNLNIEKNKNQDIECFKGLSLILFELLNNIIQKKQLMKILSI